MIWEVDETLNNAVSYIEFNIMYCRIRQTGGKTLQSVTQSRSLFLVLYSVFYFPLTSLIFFSSSMHADPFGMELRKLFTVCDFMMNDKNGDGCVTMDEAVQVAVLLQLVIPQIFCHGASLCSLGGPPSFTHALARTRSPSLSLSLSFLSPAARALSTPLLPSIDTFVYSLTNALNSFCS